VSEADIPAGFAGSGSTGDPHLGQNRAVASSTVPQFEQKPPEALIAFNSPDGYLYKILRPASTVVRASSPQICPILNDVLLPGDCEISQISFLSDETPICGVGLGYVDGL
jgi:hypothetical protein